MRILDVLSETPWAIMPAKKQEIDSIYVAHKLNREKVDLDAVEKKIGAPLNNQPKGYTVQDGVAVLPIEGVIAKRMAPTTTSSSARTFFILPPSKRVVGKSRRPREAFHRGSLWQSARAAMIPAP